MVDEWLVKWARSLVRIKMLAFDQSRMIAGDRGFESHRARQLICKNCLIYEINE